MEILIPGLILVALMVWASTKIKKNAAKAYEPEPFENDRFTIMKPEGFLSPTDPGRGLLYTAYSKDFGTDEADGIRHAVIEVSEHPKANFAEVRERIAEAAESVSEEPPQKIGEHRCQQFSASASENGVELQQYHKLIESGDGILQLKITVLAEYAEEYADRVASTLESFTAN